MPRALKVCSVFGCPNVTPYRECFAHRRTSTRNHRGVPRQERGHGADYDRRARELRGQMCAMQLPGCTGVATGGNYIRPGDWTSELEPACSHCQSVQGGRMTAARAR